MQEEDAMIIRYGADVITAEGDNAGKVKFVVIDPTDQEATHIILEKGKLVREDRVLPMSLVADSNEDRVKLYELEEPLDELPLYKEEHYIKVENRKPAASTISGPAILYDYPPIGMEPQPGREEQITRTPKYRSIHGEAEPIRQGAKVMTMGGEHVGDVAEIVIDPQTDDVTHFVITKGILLVEEKLVPVDWIDEIEETELRLAVDKNVISNLPDYQEERKIEI